MNKLLMSLIMCCGMFSLNAQLGAVTLVSPIPAPSPLLSGVSYNFIFEYEYLPVTTANVVDLSTVVSTAITGSAIFGSPVVVGSFVSISVTPTSGDLTISIAMDDNDAATIASVGTYISSPLVVPVEFGEIKYEERNEGMLVSWTTYSELNSDFFELERSYDGRIFESVERVSGAGTSADIMSYEVRDNDIEMDNARLFYRIKQVDIDGLIDYSKVLTVRKSDNASSLTIESIRNTGNLNLLVSSGINQEVSYSLFTVSGQSIVHGKVQITKGQNLIEIEKSNYRGVAIVSINDGQELISKKIFL